MAFIKNVAGGIAELFLGLHNHRASLDFSEIERDELEAIADDVAAAPTKEEGGGLLGLLGFEPSQRSLAIEKAEVQSDIKRRLSREKKLFGVVSKSAAAKQLEAAGNKIDVEGSKQTSQSADLALRVFDQEKTYTGAISTALNQAAQRIADGENPKKVKDETYQQVLKQIQETYTPEEKDRVLNEVKMVLEAQDKADSSKQNP